MRVIRIVSILLGLTAVEAACPDIELDWGTYKGGVKNKPDICIYENVRFASPPTGKLRFAKPAYPPSKEDPPSPSGAISCVRPTDLACSSAPPGGGPAPVPGCDKTKCLPGVQDAVSEDCLFLDVYVPSAAFDRDSKKLPVVVWFFGGGFISGSKRPYSSNPIDFYPGSDILSSIDSQAVFVAGNYRIGAYGWLAGSYMEENAQPNAGLYDQRAILTFVKDHISQFKGNSSRVSVWGESAGASSILHHMTMKENIEKPLFHSAVLQSPAYQWLWDRTGKLNDSFTQFAEGVAHAAGCETADIDCLREKASAEVLADQNNKFQSSVGCTGIIPVGPSVDGVAIKSLTPNSLAANHSVNLTSLIVSHVKDEVPVTDDPKAASFIPAPIRQDPWNETKFNEFLEEFFKGEAYKDVRKKVSDRYASEYYLGDQTARAAEVISDSSFLCNTRNIIDAYLGKKVPTYAMIYAFGAKEGYANHGSDLIPLFSRSDGTYVDLFDCLSCGNMNAIIRLWISNTITKRIGPGMQSYFMSLALHDDPNAIAVGEAANKTWSKAYIGDCDIINGETCVQGVMQPVFNLKPYNVFKFNQVEDVKTSNDTCAFWAKMAKEVEKKSDKEKGSSFTGEQRILQQQHAANANYDRVELEL